jgi:ABC-2 type transport system ATP-binding protein
MHDPAIVLLDEPTTGLDPQARRMLWETLRRLHASGITFILTTHYMEEADRLCERLAIVDHGRILTQGTPTALRASLGTGQILELTLGAGGPLAPIFASVAGVSRVERMDSSAQRERLRLFVAPAAGLIDRVLDAARAHGADIQHVSLQAPSLEDVYVHLTGRELRE